MTSVFHHWYLEEPGGFSAYILVKLDRNSSSKTYRDTVNMGYQTKEASYKSRKSAKFYLKKDENLSNVLFTYIYLNYDTPEKQDNGYIWWRKREMWGGRNIYICVYIYIYTHICS